MFICLVKDEDSNKFANRTAESYEVSDTNASVVKEAEVKKLTESLNRRDVYPIPAEANKFAIFDTKSHPNEAFWNGELFTHRPKFFESFAEACSELCKVRNRGFGVYRVVSTAIIT